jgi:hypothetical protein
LICAVPVACASLAKGGYADDVVCLDVPEGFYAVGQPYGTADDAKSSPRCAGRSGPGRLNGRDPHSGFGCAFGIPK